MLHKGNFEDCEDSLPSRTSPFRHLKSLCWNLSPTLLNLFHFMDEGTDALIIQFL